MVWNFLPINFVTFIYLRQQVYFKFNCYNDKELNLSKAPTELNFSVFSNLFTLILISITRILISINKSTNNCIYDYNKSRKEGGKNYKDKTPLSLYQLWFK